MGLTSTVLITTLLLKITCSTITEQDYNLMPDLFHFDDYDKCIYRNSDMEASYCFLTVELMPKQLNSTNVVWNIIEEVSSNPKNYRHDLLRHGVCTSGKCQKYNETKLQCFNRIYNRKYKSLGLESEIQNLRCEKKESDYVFGIKDLIIIYVLEAYVVFVVLISIWRTFIKCNSEITETYPDKKKLSWKEDVFSAFSLYDNTCCIINKNVKNPRNAYINFLPGLRFFTSLVIVIIHSISFNFSVETSNTKEFEELADSFSSKALAHVATVVQSFFVISLMLMTISFYEKLKRKNRITIGDVFCNIIKRYIRLTSGQFVLIALHSSLLIHLFRGPFWEQEMGFEYKQCGEKWWANLLYISNFFLDDGMCLFQTWFLSVDFQLTVLGSLILWLIQGNPKHLFWVSGLLVFFQIVYTSFYLSWNNFEFCTLFAPELFYHNMGFLTKQFQATWTTTFSNLSGLASGLILGYLYIQHKDKKNSDTKNINHVLWWASVLILTFGTIFFSAYYRTTSYYSNSKWFTATYGSIEKSLCFFGIALFIFGMSRGLGGFVKSVLEWSPMHTFGQLSYGIYLVHVTVFKVDIGSRRFPTYISSYLLVTDAVKILSVSYLGSIVLTLFLLMPIEKLSRRFVRL